MVVFPTESQNAEEIIVNFLPSENTVTISVWRDDMHVSYLVVNKHDATELANKILKEVTRKG